MTDARNMLIETLRHIIDGGDINNEELAAVVANPGILRGAERKAWHGLSYWADDDDIRAKDIRYGLARRHQLADLLAALTHEDGRTAH